MPIIEKVKKEWSRTEALAAQPAGVDKENNIIKGVVVAQMGPFKSQGRGEFDQQSLESIHALMTGNKNGTKIHLGHESACENSLGNFLGKAWNPQLSTTTNAAGESVPCVRADYHMAPSAMEMNVRGGTTPPGKYVMQRASEAPDAISTSLVLRSDKLQRMGADGEPMKDANGDPMPPLWRPTKILGTDVVTVGDAVDGMLEAMSGDDVLTEATAMKAAALLDAWIPYATEAEFREKLGEYTERYCKLRFSEKDEALVEAQTTNEMLQDSLKILKELSVSMKESPKEELNPEIIPDQKPTEKTGLSASVAMERIKKLKATSKK